MTYSLWYNVHHQQAITASRSLRPTRQQGKKMAEQEVKPFKCTSVPNITLCCLARVSVPLSIM